MHKKLKLLKKSADDIDMVIHPTKSHFMCLNSTENEDFILDNASICYTDSCTYLGIPISCRSVNEQVQQHLNAKSSHVLKFTSSLEICVEQCISECKHLQLWDMADKRT